MVTLARAWKSVQLLGGLALVLGVVLLLKDAANGVTRPGSIDRSIELVPLLIAGGFFTLMVGKFGSWWYGH